MSQLALLYLGSAGMRITEQETDKSFGPPREPADDENRLAQPISMNDVMLVNLHPFRLLAGATLEEKIEDLIEQGHAHDIFGLFVRRALQPETEEEEGQISS